MRRDEKLRNCENAYDPALLTVEGFSSIIDFITILAFDRLVTRGLALKSIAAMCLYGANCSLGLP